MTETLRRSLRRLNTVLEKAVAKAHEARPGAAADPFRGLYIERKRKEIEKILSECFSGEE
jgi:hypothetical protein